MNEHADTVDLGRLSLSPGQASSLELEVLPRPIHLGGQDYVPVGSAAVPARLDVSRTSDGFALRLRLHPELRGPCVRCLGEARLELEIDAWEIEHAGANDDELRSPYVDEAMLDVDRWANDAIALAVPSQPLCRADCAGLCPVCGESLKDAAPDEHRHEGGGDPRMAKLRELRLE